MAMLIMLETSEDVCLQCLSLTQIFMVSDFIGMVSDLLKVKKLAWNIPFHKHFTKKITWKYRQYRIIQMPWAWKKMYEYQVYWNIISKIIVVDGFPNHISKHTHWYLGIRRIVCLGFIPSKGLPVCTLIMLHSHDGNVEREPCSNSKPLLMTWSPILLDV